jgi:hypothetical protein
MVELLVSLLLFAMIMAMLVGINALPGQTTASGETQARNQVQDGVRSVLAELTTGLRQAGGERKDTGVAAVNCLNPHLDSSDSDAPWVPCLTVQVADASDQESLTKLIGFRFFDLKGEQQCEQAWYEYVPYEKEYPGGNTNTFIWTIKKDTGIIKQRRITESPWDPGTGDSVSRRVCAGYNSQGDLNPSNSQPLLSNVLGFNITVLCRNIDPNIEGVVEAEYPDDDGDPTTYEAPKCLNSNGRPDPAWYPATAIVSIFAASEAENVESSNQTGRIDRTGFRKKLDSSTKKPADSPRCVEVPDYKNPPADVDVCPVGQVCYCLEERVELANFRNVNFP